MTQEKKTEPLHCGPCGKTFENETVKLCGGCKKVPYCSIECQTKDFPMHKHYCMPPQFGIVPEAYQKYLSDCTDDIENMFTAKTDIAPLTEVLVDDPVFFLTTENFTEYPEPMQKMLHGDAKEKFVWYRDERFPETSQYNQCLLQLAADKTLWISELQTLKVNWKDQKLSDAMTWNRNLPSTQADLETVCKKIKMVNPLEIYMLQKLLGPSLTEVYSRSTFNKVGDGLFMNAWRFSHSCAPNCMSFLAYGKLRIITLRPIKAGEILSLGYHPLILAKPRSERQKQLKINYNIKNCYCDRCIKETAEPESEITVDQEDLDIVSDAFRGMMKATNPEEAYESLSKLNDIATHIKNNMLLYRSVQMAMSAYVIQLKMAMEGNEEVEKYLDAIGKVSNLMDLLLKDPKWTDKIPYFELFYNALSSEQVIQALLFYVKLDDYNVEIEIAKQKNDSKAPVPVSADHLETAKVIKTYVTSFIDRLGENILDLEMAWMGIPPGAWRRNRDYYKNL